MSDKTLPLDEMNARSREVFRRVVESYLDTGAPVGSRTLTRNMTEKVSAATVRNVMQDLEYMGLLGSPHISAGRVPTQAGLRMFVDGLMEVSDLSGDDRQKLDATLSGEGDVASALDRVSSALSGVTRGASVVLTPKTDSAPIRQIEFVSLSPDRALVVLVFADGHVENRLFTPPAGLTPSAMREAANMLSAIAGGRTLSDLSVVVAAEIDARRQEIDSLASALVQAGVAAWVQEKGEKTGRLIVRGTGNLLADTDAGEDLNRIRNLFDDLERQSDIAEFLDLARSGDGVRIFIGSENKLFSLTGSSLVLSPYMNADRKIVGAIGVIGPTRLNYGRIIPIVDYTAQLVGKLIAERS
ncbi:heat-inducible transcriptional repressor HrcA [Ketogulonicigenium vulgare]|uniref:Heat-inducible transcription repressor HrcA n=1 Tax=Ketogulonicigenium vulgare (strain WSH-001) TaxID=759362 RepID=F9Y682_KETVW|nr:heat-inducible transcriptional repressor HrcA [Ketogulonicigenium vulgare]ADO43819.1 heat-inducible transcription repressor [Ketogulonicigenium vulgare Y25]AEM42079.1 Heat-inducible transcription repressor [Ketogulonicigenium vulgare WSH-001]ALJ82174.1 heat-inducible transcription repressor [Ketogulonicigenium vulgare]ANW34794.1 heat-inducible transcriptional repressor HrcA [Ketogulonicigenium vulgare]